MLSRTADYALRVALVLARRHGGRRVRVEEIAEATGAPRNYLGKTLLALVKAGIVTSTRGPAGGFALAVAPGELTVARIVDCFDDPNPSRHCLAGAGPCNPVSPCVAHHCWLAIQAARRAPLTSTRVTDLLGGPAQLAPSSAA